MAHVNILGYAPLPEESDRARDRFLRFTCAALSLGGGRNQSKGLAGSH